MRRYYQTQNPAAPPAGEQREGAMTTEAQSESTKTDDETKPVERTLAERVVSAARAVAGTGAHDPETHTSLLGKHKGGHAYGVVRGVLRECGVETPALLGAFVDEARKRGAFVEPKGGELELSGMRPPAASVLVLALGAINEHCCIVCSSSANHIETLDGGEVAHNFGLSKHREATYERGGQLVEYRSRQWSVEVPRDEQGRQTASAFIVDGAHHGLVDRDFGVNKRHPARRVTGWIDVERYAAGATATVKS